MDMFLKLLNLDWWVYIIVVITFFTVALFLNYIVKKANDARLEERYNRVYSKVINDQPIQVRRRTLSKLPHRAPLDIVLEQSNPPTVHGISVIGEKTDNFNHQKTEDRIDIKNFPIPDRVTTDTTEIAADDVDSKPSDIEIGRQIFLGKIYNEINIIGRSKSLSDADRNNLGQETSNKRDTRQESKSIPSVKKMMDNQCKPMEDFTKWPMKLVVEEPKLTISINVVNEEIND